MAHFDLPLEQLADYRGAVAAPADLAQFWSMTLDRETVGRPTMTRVDSGLTLVDTYDVVFPGYGGDPVHGWLHLPTGTSGPLPTVVEYFGYGGGRGLAHEVGIWPLAGFASFQMDTRGQGSSFRVGSTPDPHGHGPAVSGLLTHGILDRDDYYYRRVFTDAVFAVEAAAALPQVDEDAIAVAGHSQGGGISLAAASLSRRVRGVMADVPFLCDFPRAMSLVGEFGYGEIVKYLAAHRDAVAPVLATLAYFDCSVLVESATAPALFSVALMDDVCPPSTVFAAYNRYSGPKSIEVYHYNGHEGGGSAHHRAQLAWLRGLLG